MRVAAIATVVAGLCAIAAGATLLCVHSPKMDWLPGDYERDVVLSGTFEMLDSASDSLVEYPVTVHRSQEVIRIEDRKAIVLETKKSTSPSGPLSLTPGEAVVEFAVDTRTRTYAAYRARFMVADELRTGYFTFPPHTRAESEYSMWIEEAMLPLAARYVASEQVDGLELHTYVIDATNLAVWSDSHAKPSGLGDVHIVYSVEPRTGIVVDEQSQIVRRWLDGETGWVTAFASSLGFTPETVSKNLELAKADRFRLAVIGTWMPWSVLGFGIFLAVAGTTLYGLRRATAGRR